MTDALQVPDHPIALVEEHRIMIVQIRIVTIGVDHRIREIASRIQDLHQDPDQDQEFLPDHMVAAVVRVVVEEAIPVDAALA